MDDSARFAHSTKVDFALDKKLERDANSDFGLSHSVQSVGTSASGEEQDEKKKKQLERNRETAKRCRRRKRERADALHDEVQRLRETNKELEIQLKICKAKLGQLTTGRANRGEEEEKRRIAEMERLTQMVVQKCPDEEIAVKVANFQAVYSDYGEERKRVIKAHVEQLGTLLLPSRISKMLLWILEQDDEFFSSGEGSSIWQTLMEEVGVSHDQKIHLLKQRDKLGKQNEGFKNVIRKVKSLEADIICNMELRFRQMQEITSVFTPSQQAKFLSWVENNEPCVHLLDRLWKERTSQGPASAAKSEEPS